MNVLAWLKNNKFLIVLILIAFIAGGGGYHLYRQAAPGRLQTQNRSAAPSYRLDIGQLRFYGMVEGRPALSIQADNLTVERKKIGVFRFGLMNTARMVNVQIHLYGDNKNGNPDFSKSLSDESFKSFPIRVGNVSSLEATPMDITLYLDEAVTTNVRASAASLRLKDRVIVFEGAVQIVSGQKTLAAERLSFDPQAGRFKTDKPFTLTDGNRRLQGQGLMTDIFLRPVKTQKGKTAAR